MKMIKHVDNFRIERRSGKDRRSMRLSNIQWFLRTGHRRQVRRKADRRKILVMDYYSPRLFIVFILILLLSVTDALLTLWLIDRGAMEINPVMAYYLSLGPTFFMGVKYLMTATVATIGVVLNYAVVRYFRFHFEQLLTIFAGCFALVVAWELFLISNIPN